MPKQTQRKFPPWTKVDETFLRCPIPATMLAQGALRHREVPSIRHRRRMLGIYVGTWYLNADWMRRRPRYELTHFPDADWTLPLNKLMEETGLSIKTVWRLRKEFTEASAGAMKPIRVGRRAWVRSDFPDADWTKSVSQLARDLGLSWVVTQRLRNEKPKPKSESEK